MGLYQSLLTHLKQEVSASRSLNIKIHRYTIVTGGSINEAYCLHTSKGKYMLKLNSLQAFPNMFMLEAAGLTAIQQTNAMATPQVILCDDFKDQSFLLLDWIETGNITKAASEVLGRQLAQMHRCTADLFGFEHDNYMGSLPQSNRRHPDWCSFFAEERLQPMVKLALNKRLLSQQDANNFEQLYHQLPNLFDEGIPALTHGDLWSGNYLIDYAGKPYLIDPAVSYGHREFDIAMTTLFGGFSPEFYAAYHEAYPLANGWRQRTDLWNLYPLLLHLNLFGTSYLSRVRSALKKYL